MMPFYRKPGLRNWDLGMHHAGLLRIWFPGTGSDAPLDGRSHTILNRSLGQKKARTLKLMLSSNLVS